MQQVPKNKCHYGYLLADPPEIGISKISEDAKPKKSVRRLFRQLPSHAKADNKIGQVFSLGHGS
jgi:hypothetical protein